MSDSRFALIGAHLLAEDAGIEGVSVFPAGGIFVSAIEVAPSQGLAAREVVSRAAAARQELAARETFIAIRYGATASGEREIASKCGPHFERWRELLELHRGKAELTLRAGSGAKVNRPDRRDFSSGAAYLRALREAKSGSPVPQPFLEAAREAFAGIAEHVSDVERHDGGAELAMLVPREKIDRARAAANDLRERWPDVPFLLSGPWPLEVFADEA